MTALTATVTLSERYARAAVLSMPKLASRTPRAAVVGYWIDATSYFFVAERFEPDLERMIGVPSIAQARTGTIEPVVEIELLKVLLAEHCAEPITREHLSSASFEMPDYDTLAVSLDGREYRIDRWRKQVTGVTASFDLPALYSPDQRYLCFVRAWDLWIKDRVTGQDRPLTSDGSKHWCYGQQSESCLSAVSYRRRPSPVGLWSPDSRWFLTHRIDERTLPEMTLIENVPGDGGKPVVHHFKYPTPTDPLPIGTCVAVNAQTGRMVRFDDFPFVITSFSPFSMRRVWFSDSDTAWLLRFDRYCRQVDLIRLDLAEGRGRLVISERVETGYIDLNVHIDGTPNVRTLNATDEIIWFSERDGWGHLYLYNASTGTLKNRITRGHWLVRDIVHVDEGRRRVLFLAGGIDPSGDPARKSLCAVGLDGGGFEVLLAHVGDTYVPTTEPCGPGQDRPFRSTAPPGIDPTGEFGVVRYGSADRGSVTKVVNLRSRQEFTLASTDLEHGTAKVRHFSALAADGVTPLHGVMFLPSDFDDDRRYPLMDYIYPGPQAAHQPQTYAALNASTALSLAELGFVTIMLDTRGVPVSSRHFHQVGYGTLLEPQLADHAAVVHVLCDRHCFIDRDRVGIIGQSAGGAAVVHALSHYGDVFKVGVAVCGVYDPDHYAAVWSDKYRGPPDPTRSSADRVDLVARQITGKLLLICGDMDENVHMSQTLSVADALAQANKEFELVVVPNEGHSLLVTSAYAQRRIWDYLVRNLLGDSPPVDFEFHYLPHELQRLAQRAAYEGRQ
jgi:dipeptidyl-peptidase 4